jgi:hypothetical protein
MAFGIGASELALLAALLFGGGGLSGIGVPLPPDAGLQSAAPQECVAYAAHHGSAAPDAKSSNQVEQLMAEPEIVAFSAELTRLAEEALKRMPAGEEPARTAAATLPTIMKTLLARPSMLYVSSIDPNPMAPNGRAGFVISAGEKSAALRGAMFAWEQVYLQQAGTTEPIVLSKEGAVELRKLPMPPGTPPNLPPVVWGVNGDYVFITIGEGEAEDLVKRLNAKGPAPAWLARLHEEAAILRLGQVLYVDVQAVLKLADPFIQQAAQFGGSPDVAKVIDALGVRQLRYTAVAAGLDESVSVAKLVVGHDENAAGIVGMLEKQPLTKADLATLPRAADFALVGRVNGGKLYQAIFELVQSIDQRAADEWREGEGQIRNQLGLDVRENLAALGDVWTLYNSPGDGGSLLTGLCASVSVRDRAKVDGLIEQILRLAAAAAEHDGDAKFVLQKIAVGERTVSFVQFGGGPIPVAPAWCLTEDRLIVAASPQMLRAHLSRPADAESIADVPEVARQLASGDVTALSYADGRGAAAFLYSYAQYLATMGAGALEKETGIRADIAKFPSFAAIERHLQPSIAVSRTGKTTISLESYSVGPALGPVAPMMGFGAGMALFGVRAESKTVRGVGVAAPVAAPVPVPPPQ